MPISSARCRVASVALALALAACGADGSSPGAAVDVEPPVPSPTPSPGPSGPPAPIESTVSSSPPPAVPGSSVSPTVPTSSTLPEVPPGTVLRIADQYGLFEGVLGFAEHDDDIPYDVSYVTLTPGPTQLQAFRAGEVDLGVVSPLGLVQAASGSVDVHAVARWRSDFALYALVTAPGVEGIEGWDDLRGRRVAFQRHTLGEVLVMLALDRLDMSLDDITVVDVPHHNVSVVLQSGDADVGMTSEPFVSTYLDANPSATYVLGVDDPAAQSTLVVASDAALADPALSAAIAEYLARLDRSFAELTRDRDEFADLAVLVWNLDRTYVDRVLESSDGVRMEAVPGDLLAPYRRLVELLAARGDVADDLDVSALFDERFSGLFGS